MTNPSSTHQELIEEISVLKQKNKELEQVETERKLVEKSLKQSEAHYRLLTDHMKDHVWLMDLNLKPTYISPSVEKSRGYTLEEIVQLPLDKNLTATSLQSAMEFFSVEMPKAMADPTYYLTRSLELEFYRKDGSTYWLENTFSLIRDENGKAFSLQGVGRDITDRKQAEKDLLESEQLFRLLFNSINDAVFLHYGPGPNGFPGKFIEMNNIAWERLGYSREELLEMSPLDIDAPDTVKTIPRMMEKLNRDKVAIWEGIHLTKDGLRIPVEINNQLIDFKGIPAILSTARDITDRKRAGEALRESETKLQAIFDTVGTGIIIIDKETQVIIEANQTAIEMAGLPKERIIGQICHSLVCPAQVGKCPVKDLGQIVDRSERKLLCADGHQKDILKTVYPITIKARECYVESFIDISARLRAEEELQESEERYRAISESSHQAICIIDDQGKITWGNDKMQQLGGYSREQMYEAESFVGFIASESIEFVISNFGSFVFKLKGVIK